MKYEKFMKIIKSLLKGITEIVSVLIGLVAAVLGYLNIWDTQILFSVFCALFSLIILYCLMENRSNKETRDEINHCFQDIRDKMEVFEEPSIDELFYRNNEFKEREVIRSARNNLVMLQETGNLIIEKNKADLLNYLYEEGKLKIAVCSKDNNTLSYLAFRNSDLTDVNEFKSRAENFIHQIKSICKDLKDRENIMNKISIRYIPYPISITGILSEDSESKRMVIRYADFKSPYNEKIDIYINWKKDPKVFNYYKNQINKYYMSSYKKILVTGEPHSGKTTLIKSLIKRVKDLYDSNHIYYVISEEIMENYVRIGYQVSTSLSEDPRCFAKRNETNEGIRYDVIENIIDDIADEINVNKHKILIIDEIGIMQFQSQKFKNSIENIINNSAVTLFATITKNTENQKEISYIKNHFNCECLDFKREKSDEMLQYLEQELCSSVDLYEILHENYIESRKAYCIN